MLAARWVSLLLWFHPLVWLVQKAHASACEEVCDAIAADYSGDTESYSGTLARVALNIVGRTPAVGGIPMIRTSEITQRLRKLKRGISWGSLSRRAVAIAFLLIVLTLGIVGTMRLTTATQGEGTSTWLKRSADDLISTLRNVPKVWKWSRPTAHSPVILATTVTVVDEAGIPIEGALITPDGLRASIKDGGGGYGWRHGNPTPLRTDSQGMAQINYPETIEPGIRTGGITFSIKHPDYYIEKVYDFCVQDKNEPVVLAKAPKPYPERLFDLCKRIADRRSHRSDAKTRLHVRLIAEEGDLGGVEQVLARIRPGGKDWLLNLHTEVLFDEYDFCEATVEPRGEKSYFVPTRFVEGSDEAFRDLSREIIGRSIAIVLDGEVLSTPTCHTEIRNGKFAIHSHVPLARNEAEEIASIINDATPKSLLDADSRGFEPEGDKTNVEKENVESGSVQGQVWIGNRPAGDSSVIYSRYAPESGPTAQRPVPTDSEGRFEVRDLPPGKYRFQRFIYYEVRTSDGYTGTGTGTHGATVEVKAGAMSHAEIGGKGRLVIGRLAPQANTNGEMVSVHSLERRLLQSTDEGRIPGDYVVLDIAEDGTFTIPDVRPGEWKTSFTAVQSMKDAVDRDVQAIPNRFVIPAATPGQEEEPYDLGDIELRLANSEPGSATGDSTQVETGNPPRLQFRLVVDQKDPACADTVTFGEESLCLAREVLLDETDVVAGDYEPLEGEMSGIEALLTITGSEKMEKLVEKHRRQRMAILLDGAVLSVAPLEEQKHHGFWLIVGRYSKETAMEILEVISGHPAEATVMDDNEKENMFIDLDTGKLSTPPENLDNQDVEAVSAWVRENGIDALCETSESVRGLVAFDTVSKVLRKTGLSEVKPEEIVEKSSGRKVGTASILSTKEELPAAYLIRTREGGEMLLRITDILDEPPRGVKILFEPWKPVPPGM